MCLTEWHSRHEVCGMANIGQVKGGYVGQQAPAARTPAKQGESHTVVPGDTLWKLAQEAYGDPTKWPLIRDANTGKVKMDGDKAIIQPGAQLKIPELPKPPEAAVPNSWSGNGLRVPTGPSEGLRIPPEGGSGEGLKLPDGWRIGGKPTAPSDPLQLPGGGRIGGKPTLPDDPLQLPGGGRIGGKPVIEAPDFAPAKDALGAYLKIKPGIEKVQSWLEGVPSGIRERVLNGEKLGAPYSDIGSVIRDTKAAMKAQLDALPADQRENFGKLLENEFSNRPFAKRALLETPTVAPAAPVQANGVNGVGPNLAAEISRAGADNVVQFTDFGRLVKAMGKDLAAAKTKEEAKAILERSGEALSQLYDRTLTLPTDAENLQAAMAAVPQAFAKGGAAELIAFGERLEALKTPALELTPSTYVAMARAVSNKSVSPNEFGPVLRAMVSDLEKRPEAETVRETAGAVGFLATRLDLQSPHAPAARGLLEELRQVMLTNLNDQDLTRLAGEFDKLK